MINNDSVDKKIMMSLLFDQYKDLLTKKQREYFNLYMNEDYSLNEIADDYNVSKNAIFDSVNKTEKNLLDFEKKLNLVKKFKDLSKIIDTYNDSKNEEVESIINKLKEVIN